MTPLSVPPLVLPARVRSPGSASPEHRRLRVGAGSALALAGSPEVDRSQGRMGTTRRPTRAAAARLRATQYDSPQSGEGWTVAARHPPACSRSVAAHPDVMWRQMDRARETLPAALWVRFALVCSLLSLVQTVDVRARSRLVAPSGDAASPVRGYFLPPPGERAVSHVAGHALLLRDPGGVVMELSELRDDPARSVRGARMDRVAVAANRAP